MALILSLDFGTLGIRAGVYDTEAKAMLGSGSAPYPTMHPRQGWAEQAPDAWWEAFLLAAAAAMDAAGRREIHALCVSATSSTVVAAKRDGTPLRPAILWMDCRAAAESRFTETVEHPVLKYSGGGDAVEWLVPKAMWLARHEPEIYANADIICEAVDWINFRLTGQWAGSQLNAVCKWNFDPFTQTFSPELFAAFGIPELLEKLPARIIPIGQVVGTLLPDVAAKLGITTANPIIAQGGIDAHMAIYGAGTVAEGGMLMIGGTSVVHLVQAAKRPDVTGIWGPYPNALIDGLWLLEGGQVSGGSVLSWLSDKIFALDTAGRNSLIADALALEPGAGDLLTLDSWMGNRTPYRDPNMRGAILGLSLFHDRTSLYRSVVDSVALGSANVVESLRAQDVAVDRIVIAGGIAKNPLWLRATVDAVGLPAYLVRDENLSLIGGAVSAACGLGIFNCLESASAALSVKAALLEPSRQAHQRYGEMIHLYRDATHAIAPLAHKLVAGQFGRHAS
jgi:ribulose kinase